jgi:cell division protein FtsL
MYHKLYIFFSSTFFKILLAIIIIFAFYHFYLNYQELLHVKEEIKRLNREIELTREEQRKLEEEVKKLDDLEYIEEVARKELGLVKPGELLLIPVEEE